MRTSPPPHPNPSGMTHYLLCDLRNDPALIEQYEAYHAAGAAWPEVTAAIREAGITAMEIYRAGDRLLMVMQTTPDYRAERHAELNATVPRVVEWEALMDRFQQRLPFAEAGVKWVPMRRIFDLAEQP